MPKNSETLALSPVGDGDVLAPRFAIAWMAARRALGLELVMLKENVSKGGTANDRATTGRRRRQPAKSMPETPNGDDYVHFQHVFTVSSREIKPQTPC
jgi:hypothetical protein